MVVLGHMSLLMRRPELTHGIAYGSIGVVVFFLLSGFLIDHAVQKRAGTSYALRDFLIDRSARIYVCFVPALIFTAALVAPFTSRPDFVGEPNFGAVPLIGNVLMLQDYPLFQVARRIGFDAPWFIRPYALGEPYWTIPIELFLYIGFGIAYFSATGRAGRIRAGLMVLSLIALVPVLYHAAAGYGQCLTLTWLTGVAVSRVMSTRFGNAPTPPLAAPRKWLIATVIATSVLLLALRAVSRSAGVYDLQNALFMGLLMLGGLWAASHAGFLAHPLVRKPAALLAKTSYALYLTHNVILGIATMQFGRDLSLGWLALIGLICHLVALAFWWLFDRHYRAVANRVRGWRAPATVTPSATAATPR
ncbi:acyltransferase [soil metagenome]